MMKRLTDLLARVSGQNPSKSKDPASGSLLVAAFIKGFGRCPICDQEFLDHYFTLLSVTPEGNVDGVEDLLGKVRSHQWAAAKEIRHFEPSQDALEVHVLRCPGGSLAAVVMIDPVDLYRNPHIVEYEVLDDVRSQDLKTVVGETRWLPIK